MLGSFFIDFNSFFASVEQQLNPALRGRALGVVPVMAETSCCIAASYEAKRYGIKTGTSVSHARKLCPEIIFIHAQQEKYVRVHQAAVAAVDRILPVRQVVSIDEMECVLPRHMQNLEAATVIAQRVKKEILTTVGDQLHTSIGIAPNVLLSKLASDMQKPNGLVILELADIPTTILHLPIQSFTGIGPRILRRLQSQGINSMTQLYAAPRSVLHSIWGGILGDEMYDQLRGMQPPVRSVPTRSLGHSHVLPPHMRNPTDAFAVLHRLTLKACMRLRKQGFYATAMGVSVNVAHRHRASVSDWREARFEQTQDSASLLNTLTTLWQSGLQQLMQPLGIGVQLYGLVPEKLHTASLFESPIISPHNSKYTASLQRNHLFHAIDQINRQHGKSAIYFGSAHQALDHAPMRIAFTRIPDLETEA